MRVSQSIWNLSQEPIGISYFKLEEEGGTIEKEERYQSRRKGYKPFSDISRGSRSRKGFLAPCTVLLEAVLQTRDKGRPVLRFRQCERQLRLFTLASTSRTQARENIYEKKATRSKPSLFARHAPCNHPSFTPPSAILVNILPPLIHRRHSFSLFGLPLFPGELPIILAGNIVTCRISSSDTLVTRWTRINGRSITVWVKFSSRYW